MATMYFITAILPSEKRQSIGLSHPFWMREGTRKEEHDLREFVQLAIDMGALGFLRERVESVNLIARCIVCERELNQVFLFPSLRAGRA